MKKTTYCCDRCGVVLEDNERLGDARKFGIAKSVRYRMTFFKHWDIKHGEVRTEFDLCEDCRKSLDKWLKEGGKR